MEHDASAFVGLLRDHLASHERPIVFLFGAGTSCGVNCAPLDVTTGKPSGFVPLVPAIDGLTAECKAAVEPLGKNHKAAWEKLRTECTALNLAPNIESILTRIRTKLEALAAGDSLNGLQRSEWENIDEAVRGKIAGLATPKTIPLILPHHDFTRWLRNTTRRQAVEVFTTNYDVLFERAFDEGRLPHFDGFIGSQFAFFSPESTEDDSLLPSSAWVRFWKLHGSVSWTFETVGGARRITRGAPATSGELILPSHRKYDESRKQPYRSLMDRFSSMLARDDSLLVTCGYSFGDQHINAIILDALEQHPRTHLVALSYANISSGDVVSKWAASHPNIIHAGPNACSISGRFGEWKVTGKPDDRLTTATGGLLWPDAGLGGGVRLQAGDFSSLCSFLVSMGMSPGEQS